MGDIYFSRAAVTMYHKSYSFKEQEKYPLTVLEA